MTLEQSLRRQMKRVVRFKRELRPYQRDELIPFMLRNPKSGEFVDMGLGKTVSATTVLSRLFSRDWNRKALIIAPLRVAVQTWPTELGEWEHTWWMTHSLIRADEDHPGLKPAMRTARQHWQADGYESSAKAAQAARSTHMELQRRQLARGPELIHIINREMVTWLVDFWKDKWPYDIVIVDESTSFADHKSKRWKALKNAMKYVRRVHLLSGIPAPEGIADYFAQVYLLDRGQRFGRTVTGFRERYLIYNSYNRKWTPQQGAEQAVAAKIADICIVMRQEDYLGRDKPLVVERPIILTKPEMKMYRDFMKTLVLTLPDGQEIEAANASALGQKLMQFASGAVYDEERKGHKVHDRKLEDLLQLREELDGSPLMIAYWHKSSLARLQKLLPRAITMDRSGACVTAWNKGEIQDLLIHPASAGHGLNMQLGPGHTINFFDNPWSLELYQQIIARLDRSGQKRPVRVFHQVTRGTLDEKVIGDLRMKRSAEETVRKYIRDLRNTMLNKSSAEDQYESFFG